MIELVDPCESCVVLACCEQMCSDRSFYTQRCQHLFSFYEKYMPVKVFSEKESYQKDYEELKILTEAIRLRNETKLLPKFTSSSSCQSSGISMSSSSTYVTGSGYKQIDKKLMKKITSKMAKIIDNDILRTYLDKTKESFGFYSKRKT
jgi:hypothetical protein